MGALHLDWYFAGFFIFVLGLAATGRPKQGDQLARVNVEADITQCMEVTKLLVNVSNFDAHDATFNDRSKGAALIFSGGRLPMAFISRS